jgi:hypothetical protein
MMVTPMVESSCLRYFAAHLSYVVPDSGPRLGEPIRQYVERWLDDFIKQFAAAVVPGGEFEKMFGFVPSKEMIDTCADEFGTFAADWIGAVES